MHRDYVYCVKVIQFNELSTSFVMKCIFITVLGHLEECIPKYQSM